MADPTRELVFFVATRPEDVPAQARRFASVDGSVPGAAVTWDHHVSGELVNLDALPGTVSTIELDGVATTLADTDAVASAVTVALGGTTALSSELREVLLAASHWCDHLGPHPRVSAHANELGRGLHHWTTRVLRTGERPSDGFARAVRELLRRIESSAALPFEAPDREGVARARALIEAGRIRAVGRVAVVDLRGVDPIDPLLVYEVHRHPVAVTIDRHRDGGVKYTIGVNPLVPHPDDLGAALARLAALEHARGRPALRPEPGPGSENWGGRATVFGSPWNYGSRLAPDEVAREVAAALGLER